MQLDWWTLLFQTINFLILVWLLQRFLYRPVLAIIDRRRKATDSLVEEAQQARNDAKAEHEGLEAERKAIGRERDDVLANAKRDADEVRDSLLADAREDIDRMLVETRTQIAREREDAATELRRHATILAVGLAGHVLTAVAGENLGNAFFDAAVVSLNALPKEELDGLRAAIERVDADAPALHLVTARSLGPEQKARYLAALAKVLGHEPMMTYDVDDSLIAGVELHLPHTIVHHSARSALQHASQELDDDHATR